MLEQAIANILATYVKIKSLSKEIKDIKKKPIGNFRTA